jgi:tyrosine-protein kinase Etk/Wzc
MRDAKVASELYVLLLNKAQELQVMKSGTIGNVRILDGALVPQDPVSPTTRTTLALSLLLGVTLGIAIAFARKALDQGVEDPDVIERETGLPVYATIPHSPAQATLAHALRKRASAAVPVLAATQPDDLAVEAVRSLRTSLQFALADASNNIIAIAGPSPSIGKSFISVNLAHVLADAGKRVLLVDADLRKGHLHRYFGVAKLPGLSDLIRGTAAEKDAIRKTTVDKLHFLAMGERPPNPSELLLSSRFQSLMAWASSEHDLVLIDTAPVLAVTDATLACRPAGTTLLVFRGGQHPLREIAAATKRMMQSGVTPRAIILNDVMPKAAGYAYSRYGYHYHYEYK